MSEAGEREYHQRLTPELIKRCLYGDGPHFDDLPQEERDALEQLHAQRPDIQEVVSNRLKARR
jgi:hypothetical protein